MVNVAVGIVLTIGIQFISITSVMLGKIVQLGPNQKLGLDWEVDACVNVAYDLHTYLP